MMFFHRVVGFAGVYATQNYLEEKNLHNNWRISINEEGLMVFGRDVDRLKAINRRLNDSWALKAVGVIVIKTPVDFKFKMIQRIRWSFGKDLT